MHKFKVLDEIFFELIIDAWSWELGAGSWKKEGYLSRIDGWLV